MIFGLFQISTFAAFVIGVFSMIACGVAAKAKGRDPWGWVALGFLFGPLAAALVLFFPSLPAPGAASTVAPAAVVAGVSSELRLCPFCAEEIKRVAIKCKHCGSEVVPEPEAVEPVAAIDSMDTPADPEVYVVKSEGNGQAGRLRKR